MYLGESPYSERTPLLANELTKYRYSPLLSFLLLPNVWVSGFGKVLFAVCDVAAAFLMEALIRLWYRNLTDAMVAGSLVLWLFNPFVFLVSTRGSSDALVTLLLMVMLWFLSAFERRRAVVEWYDRRIGDAEQLPGTKRYLCLAGALYGLVVHLRL